MSLASFFLCLIICATISPKGNHSVDEYVDLIELNHFYDQLGRPVYDQVIFYERAPETGRFQVRSWCLVEDRESLNRRPIRNHETQLYQVDWFDTDQRLLRKITSRLYRESWTQIDPERVNKRVHDERSRIAMAQSPKKFQAIEPQSPQLDETKQTANDTSITAASIGHSPAPPPRAETLVAK